MEKCDVVEWVRRSRLAQGLSETVEDPDTIAAVASLVILAQETEVKRQADRKRAA
ncbi:hypothetical protein ACIPX0_38215 [Streptomyces sp. NPDC090075]|uniref:hypothetical protein n=1 Tax=Streptomyces sp. NPDC090075 TaxID=3365937 RepID=UPI0038032C87